MNFRHTKDLKVNGYTIKLLENNMGIVFMTFGKIIS